MADHHENFFMGPMDPKGPWAPGAQRALGPRRPKGPWADWAQGPKGKARPFGGQSPTFLEQSLTCLGQSLIFLGKTRPFRGKASGFWGKSVRGGRHGIGVQTEQNRHSHIVLFGAQLWYFRLRGPNLGPRIPDLDPGGFRLGREPFLSKNGTQQKHYFVEEMVPRGI